jgi:hypothetical protein
VQDLIIDERNQMRKTDRIADIGMDLEELGIGTG